MLLSGIQCLAFDLHRLVNIEVVGSRTHGRVTFSLQQAKVTKKCRPEQLVPCKQRMESPSRVTLPTRRFDALSMRANLNQASCLICATKVPRLGKL